MSERFSAQLALVAGGTGGLERAVSIEFLEEGATVVVTSITTKRRVHFLVETSGTHVRPDTSCRAQMPSNRSILPSIRRR